MPECILASWMTTRGSLTPSCSEVVTVFVSCVAAGVVAVVVSLWAGAFARAGMLV